MSIESLQTNNQEELKQFDIDQLEKKISNDIQILKNEIMPLQEKEKTNVREVELQKDGKVNIPYDRNGKKYDIIVQKIWKTVKLSVEVSGKEVAKLDKLSIWSNADLRKYVGNLLDTYITDKNRKPIPEKVDRAYKLLEAQDLISAYNIKVDKIDKEIKIPFSITFSNGGSGDPDIYDYDIILTKNGAKVEWEIDEDWSINWDKEYEWSLESIISKIEIELLKRAWRNWEVYAKKIQNTLNALKKVFIALFN